MKMLKKEAEQRQAIEMLHRARGGRTEDVRHSPLGKASYALRSQTIERVFADAKEKHAMRYTPYRGLPAVTAWAKLKFAAMNLKKLAIHKWMRLLFSAFLSYKKPDCKLAIWLL